MLLVSFVALFSKSANHKSLFRFTADISSLFFSSVMSWHLCPLKQICSGHIQITYRHQIFGVIV